MVDFFRKHSRYILVAIVALSAVLIFTNLTRADIQHDDATYSFRSVGYLDYMNTATRQTTPIQWFDQLPWWTHLSFHDHPPLVFIIQHLFFLALGVSDFTARLPFAVAGVGTVIALYFLAKELYDEKVGLLASGLLAVSSYHTWASRIGYLEGFATLLIVLSLWAFVKSLKNSKYLYLFGLLLGLTILTKYTILFVIPAVLIYLLLKKREVFRSVHFYASALMTLVLISPVIVYNFMMYKTRGHFDLQLSILFNQSRADWPGISRSIGGFHLIDVLSIFFNNYSILFSIAAAAALAYLLIKLVRNFKTDKNILVLLVVIFAFIFFAVVGPEVRLLSVINPLVAVLLSLGIFEIFSAIKKFNFSSKINWVILVALLLLAGYELFYNINTNILNQPVGEPVKQYSPYRWATGGFHNLDTFLLKNKLIASTASKKIVSMADVQVNVDAMTGKDIFIYDPDLNWFATLWYFARYQIYNDYVFVSAADLNTVVPASQWLSSFKDWGIRNMYYIVGENNVVVTSEANKSASANLVKAIAATAKEKFTIDNNSHQPAFTMYQIKIN